MSNFEAEIYIVVILTVLWIGVFYMVRQIYKSLNQIFKTKDLSGLEIVTKNSVLCNVHTWEKLTIYSNELPKNTYNACRECGFISSNKGKYKLNKLALLNFQIYLKKSEDRIKLFDQLNREREERSHDIMNKMIREHIELLGPDIHKNVEVLKQFFRKSNYELESLNSELNDKFDRDSSNG